MTILLFGKGGQVGQFLSVQPGVTGLGRVDADLRFEGACIAAIERHRPSAVINAAAYTAVDRAEDEEGVATRVNGAAPGEMAKGCARLDIPFVHISTDYVFDGSGNSAWIPNEPPSPLSAYGRSKLSGENAVSKANGRYAILRTSWVFSPHGQNFVKTILRLGRERKTLSIVADQVGGPTPAAAIAQACIVIAEKLKEDASKSGIYHFSGYPDVSRADFAREIFSMARIDCGVSDISTADYATPALRPLNSRLDCSSTQSTFGISRPAWRSSVQAATDFREKT